MMGWKVLALVTLTAIIGAGCAPAGDSRPGSRGGRDSPIDLSEVVALLPMDSIPSIDDPKFVTPDKATFLSDREPVVALEIDGDARAYPVQILTWHEIVNDEVGGEPVTITFCPLCNSAVVFDRTVAGTVLEFGTSGKLYNSALVMYDRQTVSYWLHFEGLAVKGEHTGTRLERFPAQLISFGEWKTDHPDGLVLSRDTGFSKPYGTNPYDFYDSSASPFAFRGDIDPRLPTFERVVGVEIEGEAVAYPRKQLQGSRKGGVAHDTVGGRDIVVFWKAGTASGLDDPVIALGRDVGAVGVFVPEVDGRTLTLRATAGTFVDEETGSVWSISGRAVSGPLESEELEPIHHLDSFWFAWQAHNPDTRVFGG